MATTPPEVIVQVLFRKLYLQSAVFSKLGSISDASQSPGTWILLVSEAEPGLKVEGLVGRREREQA